MNIDTLYKVLGYACLYKADTGDVDAISAAEITVSLIREGKPIKLLKMLSEKYTVTEAGHGIYRINGMLFPIQVIVTKELDLATHVWLKALTRTLGRAEAEELLERYESLKEAEADDRLNADAVVELTSNVNDELFKFIIKEGGCMSGNLLKLFLTEGGYRSEELKEMIEPELARLKVIIADKDAMLADNAAMLADKDAMLADSRAEIARLKRLLAEAGHSG